MYSIKASSFSCTENGKEMLGKRAACLEYWAISSTNDKKIQLSNPKILSSE